MAHSPSTSQTMSSISPEWLNLPSLAWSLIFDNLNLLDRIRFRTVCSFFHSISITKQPHRLSTPLLLLLPLTGSSTAAVFLNLVDQEIYPTILPQLLDKCCYGSSFGYLFTSDPSYQNIVLFNPFSKTTIFLPPLSDFTALFNNNVGFIQKATLSTNPSKGNDFIAMIIITNACMLAYCRPGDEDWSILPRINGSVDDVLFFNERFYVITNWGSLVSWDFSNANSPKHIVIIPENDEESLRKYPISRRYLAESVHGELLVVYRVVERKEVADGAVFEDCKCNSTVSFLVFKLNEEKGKWNKACLCNQALFLGRNRGICLSTLENSGFKDHCIYFTDDFGERCSNHNEIENPKGCNDIGVYDMNDDSVEKFCEDFPFWNGDLPCLWVAPNPH